MVNALTIIVNINRGTCHSCESRNPHPTNVWIPHQVRNDNSFNPNKKSPPKFAALEGFSTRNIAFSGQLEILRNNYDNRIVHVSIHNTQTLIWLNSN